MRGLVDSTLAPSTHPPRKIGHGPAEKKQTFPSLHSKRTATNLDEPIDSLQASFRILNLGVMDRVGETLKEKKYQSAPWVCDAPPLTPR